MRGAFKQIWGCATIVPGVETQIYTIYSRRRALALNQVALGSRSEVGRGSPVADGDRGGLDSKACPGSHRLLVCRPGTSLDPESGLFQTRGSLRQLGGLSHHLTLPL